MTLQDTGPGLSAPCWSGRCSLTGKKHSDLGQGPRSEDRAALDAFTIQYSYFRHPRSKNWSFRQSGTKGVPKFWCPLCSWLSEACSMNNIVHLYLSRLLASPLLDNLLRMSFDRSRAAPLHVLYSLKSFLMKGIDFNNVSFCVFRPVKSKKYVKRNV